MLLHVRGICEAARAGRDADRATSVAAAIATAAFTSEDRVREVIRNVNADGFGSPYPKYRGGRAPKFTLGQRREIKKIARSRHAGHGLPFSTWSLACPTSC